MYLNVGHIKGLISRTNRASIYLDLARGLAAIEVMMYHVRPSLLVSYTAIAHKNVLDVLLYAITDKGFQSVMVFFVLSGFFISSSVINALVEGRWSWKNYLNNRITRLWVVLIPALFLTYLLNHLSLAVFHGTALVGEMGWASFSRDVFFLQGVWHIPGIPFGENDALWSLTYEFWYYILFPCLLLIFFSKKWTMKCMYAVATIFLAVFLGKGILMYFLVWLVGSLVVVLPKFKCRPQLQRTTLILTFLLFLVALGLSKRDHTYMSDLSIGLTFGLSSYFIVSFYNDSVSVWHLRGRMCQVLASFSYTLYLTHFPINNFLVSWIHNNKMQPGLLNILMLLGIFVVIILFAWIVSLVTEAHTGRVRSFTASIFLKKSTPPAVSVVDFTKFYVRVTMEHHYTRFVV
jgi:peptidoglycan/LPS O-acetylase OafA/YrhL